MQQMETKNYVLRYQLLPTIQQCESQCEQMTTLLLFWKGVYERGRQIQLLRDCADVCALMVKYLARDSFLAKSLAQYCADVCQLCGAECGKYPDGASQHCSQVCLHCAQECRAFAA